LHFLAAGTVNNKVAQLLVFIFQNMLLLLFCDYNNFKAKKGLSINFKFPNKI